MKLWLDSEGITRSKDDFENHAEVRPLLAKSVAEKDGEKWARTKQI